MWQRKTCPHQFLGAVYLALDYFFDVSSLYEGAINGLSGAYRREEYE